MKTLLRMFLILGLLFFAAAVRSAEADNFTDDFSGGINADHWTVSAGAYTIDDTQGDIRMSKPPGPGAWGSVLFNHEVRGDFDIAVDYRDAVLAGCQNQIQLNLVFGGQYVANRRENWCESRYSVWRDPGGTAGVTGTSDTSGTLRVTRAGSTVTFYANGAQIHQQVFNSSPVTHLSLSLQNNGTSDAISVTFDNFSITADSIDGVCTPPPSGMVAWWGGDNNALDMVGTSHGTVTGAAYAPGKVAQAFSFDGVDDYVSAADSATWDFGSGDFTINAWINTDSPNSLMRLISAGSHVDGANNLWTFGYGHSEGWGAGQRLNFAYYDGSGYSDFNSSEITIGAGTWNHIAVVRSGPSLQFYFNGAPAGSHDIGSVSMGGGSTGAIIGARYYTDAQTVIEFARGLIDEASIFNRALSASEIAAIYNAGNAGICRECTPPPSGMVSWWGGDNNALDMVGGNNGSLMGGATYGTGMVGQAFSFDGGNDYVSVPHSSAWNFGSNNFTLDLWVKFNAIKSNFLACHDEGSGNQNKWCLYAGDGYLNFHINSPGTGSISIGYGTVLFPYNTGQWYHLALTRNGNTYTFYVDGAPAGTITDSNVIPDANAPLTIGQGEGAHYVNGLIDELEIFNRALSADEIAAIYNAGSAGKCRSCTPPPSNLLSWWPFEEGIGATTADILGANDGTIYGAAWAEGKVGSALSFDGVDDYADMGNSDDFNFGSGDFAISFWAKPGNGGGGDDYDHVIGKAATTSLSPYLIGIHGSEWGFWSTSDGSSWDIAQKHVFGGITLNSWQYIVITRAGTAINFYINGVQTATLATAAGLWSNTEKLLIGKIPWTAQDTHYKGLIDELQIFNRTFSAGEIAAIYNAGSAGQCAYTIGTNSPANGAIVCDSLVAGGYDGLCTMTPAEGYYLFDLTDNGPSVIETVVPGWPSSTYTISGVSETHDIVATFARYPVWRDGTPDYFMTLGEAYGGGTTAYTLKAHGAELTDSNLILTGTAGMIIDGGYLPDFSGYSGIPTTITGPLTIGGTGSVAVSNIAVR